MKYIVTYSTIENAPLFWNPTSSCKLVKHSNSESYEAEDLESCKAIVKDMLDIPIAELSLEEVKKEFAPYDGNLTEEQAVKIQKYYNGRLALYNVIMKELDDKSSWQLLKHAIPPEYANFFYDADDTENLLSEITIQRC